MEFTSWFNYIALNLSAILSFYLYILSVMPKTREKKKGEKAWKECIILRYLSELFWLILVICIFLWPLFPISFLNFVICENYLFIFTISILIIIPSSLLVFLSVKDAGSETIKTLQDTTMYGGIYNQLRHPQITGATPIFIALCLIVNSLTLLINLIILMIIIIPIVIYYEEKDLILRFGNSYINYKKETGALIPKFWTKK
ncbi:MAG: methyltransferase [Candidatus Thorarchaeota archaeon]